MDTAPAAPLQQAKPMCPAHPDVAAVGTCNRCGRYICAECAQDWMVCPDCRMRQLAQVPTSEAAAILTYVGIGCCGLARLTQALLAGAGLFVPRETGEWLVGGTQVAEGLGLLGMFGACIPFFIWSYQAVVQANAVGVDVGVSPGGAIGWWFVPCVNLVRPYQIMSQLLAGLSGWGGSGTSVVGIWWACYLTGNIVGSIGAQLGKEDPGVYLVLACISGLGWTLAAFFAIRMILSIQKAIGARRRLQPA